MYYKEKIKQGRMGVVVVERVLLISTRLIRKGISEDVTLESLKSVLAYQHTDPKLTFET